MTDQRLLAKAEGRSRCRTSPTCTHIEQVFKILNMRIANPLSGKKADDRTTKARIRDAAIERVAEDGLADTTVRSIAEAADVSAGTVIHHYGSMEGLRSACDEYIAATIRQYKQEVMSAGPELDVLVALRGSDAGSLMGYLAEVLTDDSPAVNELVDSLVADAEVYMEQFVDAGMARPTDDPRGRAVVLLIWSLGTLVMHEHMQRLLGVDLTDPEIATSPALAAYAGPVYELYGQGFLTESFAEQMRDAFAGSGDTESEQKESKAS